MYRIRFHGRGGQGMKTASRILGRAFFLEGFEVQDAPRYGAERRGAPIFAYVRASRQPITERGIIRRPDLVIVADETLVTIPAGGVLAGVIDHTVLLISSTVKPEIWQERLNLAGPVLVLPAAAEAAGLAELKFVGAGGAGAAARLVGVISREALAQAIREELAPLGDTCRYRIHCGGQISRCRSFPVPYLCRTAPEPRFSSISCVPFHISSFC